MPLPQLTCPSSRPPTHSQYNHPIRFRANSRLLPTVSTSAWSLMCGETHIPREKLKFFKRHHLDKSGEPRNARLSIDLEENCPTKHLSVTRSTADLDSDNTQRRVPNWCHAQCKRVHSISSTRLTVLAYSSSTIKQQHGTTTVQYRQCDTAQYYTDNRTISTTVCRTVLSVLFCSLTCAPLTLVCWAHHP